MSCVLVDESCDFSWQLQVIYCDEPLRLEMLRRGGPPNTTGGLSFPLCGQYPNSFLWAEGSLNGYFVVPIDFIVPVKKVFDCSNKDYSLHFL